jgi:aminoglycoside 3-N-acetyltransferase
VLLIGVGYDSNTSIHLAEYIADHEGKRIVDCYSPIETKGRRKWTKYQDLDFGWDDFERIGQDFEREREGSYFKGKIGLAPTTLIKQRDLVDYSVKWMEENRGRDGRPDYQPHGHNKSLELSP